MSDVASKLKVSELDFDNIKTNLKNFLGDQNELADYNFDGSAMAVLMDLLAYNTHYNAFYLNMIVNEMFLDTASLRNSVVSRAKHLGYTPTSVRGAKAYVDLTITPANTPSTIVIEKDTQFNEFLNDNEEAVFFNDIDDLIDKINYYKKNKVESLKIAEAGYNKLHTYCNEKVVTNYFLDCLFSKNLNSLKTEYNWPIHFYK